MDKRWFFFSVDIELSSYCGTNCRFCPRDQFTRKQGIMAEETFQAILAKLGPLKSRVTFCGLGNPLMNPKWPDFLKAFRATGTSCGLVCHARELTPDTIAKLIDARPNRVEISFPSLDRKTFDQVCKTVTYDAAHEQVTALINHPDRAFPITMAGVETKLNPSETQKYTDHWEELGVQSRVYTLHSRSGHLVDAELIDPKPPVTMTQPCGLFAIHSFITWNGDVLSCCHDLKGEAVVGNIVSDSLEHLMDRKAELSKTTPHFNLCRSCDDDYRLSPTPTVPFPETSKAATKFLKSWTP